MTRQCRLVSAYICVFGLLMTETAHSASIENHYNSSRAQITLNQIYNFLRLPDIKINRGNENITHVNILYSQITTFLRLPKSAIKRYGDDFFVDNIINEIADKTPVTNNIDGLVEVDEVDVQYVDGIHDYLAKDKIQLERFLKKVDRYFNEARRLKFDNLAKKALKYGSPFQGCSQDPYPASESKSIKKYEINLDAQPEDRWKEVVQQHSAQIMKLANFFEEKFGPVVMSVIDTALTWLHYSLPSEYYRELNGISMASGVSVARVTLYNVFYEFFTLCTSIVMEGEDGKMYHGRNLDFGIFMGWDPKNHTWFITEFIRPLIIKVDFMKNGKPLYSAVTYAGYTGILTGVKKNTFSLTIDERFIFNGGYVGLAEWIIGLRDSSWLGLLTRRVMESATSYDEAQQLLARTTLVAPAYFILAGNTSNQGSIVTRGRRDADIWPLGNRHKQQTGSWFLVETNYDHWRDTPFFDHRRQYAVQCMDKIGRQKPLETLYRVLSTRPVLNKETTLTAVMDVREGLLEVWERDCPDPCWPF